VLPNPVATISNPAAPVVTSRVALSTAGAGFTLAGLTENRDECSAINPEKCNCESTEVIGVEICFAPSAVIGEKR
jgi:hypothetical protein